MNNKIPTNHGDMTPEEIIDHLTYSSYKANRGYGATHEELLKIGIGNEAMRLKYEQETKTELHPIFQEIVNKFIK